MSLGKALALAWAKVWGFPWWPALVNAPQDKPGKLRRRRPAYTQLGVD